MDAKYQPPKMSPFGAMPDLGALAKSQAEQAEAARALQLSAMTNQVVLTHLSNLTRLTAIEGDVPAAIARYEALCRRLGVALDGPGGGEASDE